MKNRKLGVQGCPYSFNAYAAVQYLYPKGFSESETQYRYNSSSVLEGLLKEDIHYGLIALESNTGGLVEESIKALSDFPLLAALNIIDQFSCITNHVAMHWPGVASENIRHICCHPQAYKESESALSQLYPNASFRHDLFQEGKSEISDFLAMLESGELDKNNHSLVGAPTIAAKHNLVGTELIPEDTPVITRFILLSIRRQRMERSNSLNINDT